MKMFSLNNIVIFCRLYVTSALYLLSAFFVFFIISAFSQNTFAAKNFSTRGSKINKISRLISSGNSRKASVKIMSLLKLKEYRRSKPRLYFLLGLSFEKLNLKHSSVWALLQSIKSSNGSGRYAQTSLTRLLLTASFLKDGKSIKEALSLISLTSFDRKNRAKLYYILGKNYFAKNNFNKAALYFSKVQRRSSLYFLSRYFLANSLTEAKKLRRALREFKKITNKSKPYTKMHTASLLGQARVYYQLKNYKRALTFYYKVPRDSEFWLDSLQESAWTELRLNKLNGSLRHFQTIHSSYYKENYIPESLILRAVVYLKLCKYDEIKKILKIYNQEYTRALGDVSYLLKNKGSIYKFYIKLLSKKKVKSWQTKLASSDAAITLFKQIISLIKEKNNLSRFYSSRSNSARSVFKNIRSQLSFSKNSLRVLGTYSLAKMNQQLINLKKQKDFIRYELLKSRQTAIKKKIVEKKLGIQKEYIEEDKRDFYIQNGYEYWPFQGEYWLDELGNYYYIGGSSCAK